MPEHPTDAHFSFTFVFKQALNPQLALLIPAIELAVEAGHKVVVYFPPHQYSSNLASMSSSKPVQLKQYES